MQPSQMQTAKAHFSDLVRRVRQDGLNTLPCMAARPRWWCRTSCLTGSAATPNRCWRSCSARLCTLVTVSFSSATPVCPVKLRCE